MEKTFNECMSDYKRDLEYLKIREMSSMSNEEYMTARHIIRTVRQAWFYEHRHLVEKYFGRMHFCEWHECEFFFFDDCKKAVRDFNGRYYAVDVEKWDGLVATVKSPDEYLYEDGISLQSYDYPEYFMAEYFEAIGVV